MLGTTFLSLLGAAVLTASSGLGSSEPAISSTAPESEAASSYVSSSQGSEETASYLSSSQESKETASSSEEERIYPCYVTIADCKHGKVTTDITYGDVGDIVTVTADANIFYLVSSVTVNGTTLIESEDKKGEFSFAMSEGNNEITAEFGIDTELLGTFSTVYEEVQAKDWTSVFSVETVLTIVKWVLDGGVLIAIARYFVKDKKLSKSVEDKIQSTMEQIIPETTKNTVLANFKDVLTPMVSELQAENAEIVNAMGVFAKCMALSQENTPESRKAIIDELADLKVSDSSTLGDVKAYIEDMVAKQTKIYNDTLKALSDIEKRNNEIISGSQAAETEKASEDATEKETDNGTQI